MNIYMKMKMSDSSKFSFISRDVTNITTPLGPGGVGCAAVTGSSPSRIVKPNSPRKTGRRLTFMGNENYEGFNMMESHGFVPTTPSKSSSSSSSASASASASTHVRNRRRHSSKTTRPVTWHSSSEHLQIQQTQQSVPTPNSSNIYPPPPPPHNYILSSSSSSFPNTVSCPMTPESTSSPLFFPIQEYTYQSSDPTTFYSLAQTCSTNKDQFSSLEESISQTYFKCNLSPEKDSFNYYEFDKNFHTPALSTMTSTLNCFEDAQITSPITPHDFRRYKQSTPDYLTQTPRNKNIDEDEDEEDEEEEEVEDNDDDDDDSKKNQNNLVIATPVLTEIDEEKHQVSEEAGEELIGMGLYDNPESSRLSSSPCLLSNFHQFKNGCDSLITQPGSITINQNQEPLGKGLKLEETWKPPINEEDEEDEEDEEEEEDDDDDDCDIDGDETIQETKSDQIAAVDGNTQNQENKNYTSSSWSLNWTLPANLLQPDILESTSHDNPGPLYSSINYPCFSGWSII